MNGQNVNWLWPIVLAHITVLGCSPHASKRDTNYREAQLKVDSSMREIKSRFGEPDSCNDGWDDSPSGDHFYRYHAPSAAMYPYHVEKLGYGPIPGDARPQKYELELTFVDER